MSTATALRGIGRPLDDAASLGRALDELLTARPEPPTLLALGEPTHGVEAFPLLRNEVLRHLVERGYRSIALETDFFAAAVVDDYVRGGTGDLDAVLATGFSHGFGNLPSNRDLVEWLRAHNADRAPEDRVHFHGFDAPLEISGAPSPRRALAAAVDHLPAALRPESARDLDALLGDDADWTDPRVMYDPSTSIGGSDRARALRLVADDLVSALRRAAPELRTADPAGHADALAHARTAQGLLRYHAALASSAPDRVSTMLGLRDEMQADNLLAIVDREQGRGPGLVFAHNAHLQRTRSHMALSHAPMGEGRASWWSAGALVGLALGERYLFLASDANPRPAPGTLQGALAEATTRRSLFPTRELRAALPPSVGADEPFLPGHLPLHPTASGPEGADAVIFIADTDGTRHRYW
ncbi:erythromycin esterase family protein [Saccharothrix australiensis]|uniref:Erythromycin esterase-like protein n=1 Tax=Saccharothrix australiensis TaxID=2072 RepID=A0A495VXU4_9PSEU|nr:erythromycin esterase family protein [Saccharothrix australiensis]RKT54251.1 erythromycin esterase-like protein [Saccharothrix australiensis]